MVNINLYLAVAVAAGYYFGFTNYQNIHPDLKVIIKAFTIIGFGYLILTYFDPLKEGFTNIFKKISSP